MADNHRPITAPNFMSTFRCIGSACEETCCSSFIVDIDQSTFEHYQTVSDPQIGQELRKHVKRRLDTSASESYARTAPDASGSCPFLSDDKLCAIHSALGHDALSYTCRSYPREQWEQDGERRLGGKMSCPEVARLCVSDPDAMLFPAKGVGFPGNEGQGPSAAAQPDLASIIRRAVHAAVEDVARDRSVPVWKAILFAGIIAETFLSADPPADLAKADALERIREFAAQTKLEIAQTDFASGDQNLVQFKLLTRIISSAASKCNRKHNRLPLITQTAMGALFEGSDDFDGVLNRYATLYRNQFRIFDDTHEYALRNYLLNYIYLNKLFIHGPFLPEFQNLAVRFGVIRLLLVGLAGARPDGLSLPDYAAVVSSASRVIDHDASISQEIRLALDEIEPRSVALAVRMVIPPA